MNQLREKPSNEADTDSYLNEIEQQLQPIDEPLRTEYLEELTQHLEARVAANIEVGVEEPAAAASAIHQMGSPERIARALVNEWERSITFSRPAALARELTYLSLSTLWLLACIIVDKSWSVTFLVGGAGILAGIVVGRFTNHKAMITIHLMQLALALGIALGSGSHLQNQEISSVLALLCVTTITAFGTGFQQKYRTSDFADAIAVLRTTPCRMRLVNFGLIKNRLFRRGMVVK